MKPKSVVKRTKSLYKRQDHAHLFLQVKVMLDNDVELKSLLLAYQCYRQSFYENLDNSMTGDTVRLFQTLDLIIKRYITLYAMFRDVPQIGGVILNSQARAIESFRSKREEYCRIYNVSKREFNRSIPNRYKNYKTILLRNTEAWLYRLKRPPRYSRLANTSVGRLVYGFFSPRAEYDFCCIKPLDLQNSLSLISQRLGQENTSPPSYLFPIEEQTLSLPSYEEAQLQSFDFGYEENTPFDPLPSYYSLPGQVL